MSSELNKSKIQVLITMMLVLFVSITGFTYAYFAVTASNDEVIRGTAASVDLTLTVEKVFPKSNVEHTGVLIPQLSEKVNGNSPLSTALKNGCVDGNKNVVCQVYKVHIKNAGGTATQVVDGSVSFYGDTDMTVSAVSVMPNLRWKLISSVDVSNVSNSVLGENTDLVANNEKNIFADDITLKTNDEYTYHMIVWINETGEDQADMGKSFYGSITFDSSNGTGVTSTFET